MGKGERGEEIFAAFQVFINEDFKGFVCVRAINILNTHTGR